MDDLDNAVGLYNPFEIVDGIQDYDNDNFEVGDRFTTPDELPEEDPVNVESDTFILSCGNNQGEPLTASEVVWVPSIPAYPKTHISGIAYVVPVLRNGNNQVPTVPDIVQQATQFQYGKHRISTKRPSKSPFFNNEPTWRYKYGCSGVRHCEWVSNTLRTYSHNEVTEEIWDEVRRLREPLVSVLTEGEKLANSIYLGIRKRFAEGACSDHHIDCAPQLRLQPQTFITGERQWLIECILRSNRHERHFVKALQPTVDIEYLSNLFTNTARIQRQECWVVDGQNSRIATCGVNHPQGPGRLRPQPCPAIFEVVIPQNLRITPYFIVVTFGTHSHIPPPPCRASLENIKELKQVLRPMLTPGLTRSQFLNSLQLKTFLRLNGYSSIEEWEIAFTNKSRVSAIIAKEKLLEFPFTGGLEGIIFERRTRHQDPQKAYIREVLSGASGDIIICFYDSQAQVLFSQNTFQMDMSYKRLRGAWAEILIAVFDPIHNTLLTLGRVMTNSITRAMHELAFSTFFKIASERVGRPVQWRHLHGNGFYGVTLDMCSKQMAGFGRYLTSIDPAHHDWRWQLSHCTRWCQVHLLRSINVACGPTVEHVQNSVWTRMRSLLHATTSEDYYQILDLLIENEESPNVRAWAKNKKNAVMAAGIVRCCSRMREEVWNMLETHTNAAEQAGQKGYRTGKNVCLLEAIRNAEQMDKEDMLELEAKKKYGIRQAYRGDSSLSQRYFLNRGRDQKRKRNEFQPEVIDLVDSDEEIPTIEIPMRGTRSVSQASSRRRLSRSPSTRLSPATQRSASTPRPTRGLQRQTVLSQQHIQSQREQLELERQRLQLTRERLELEERIHALETERRQQREGDSNTF